MHVNVEKAEIERPEIFGMSKRMTRLLANFLVL